MTTPVRLVGCCFAHAFILAAKWGGGHGGLVADDALTQFDIGEQCVANWTGHISEAQ